MCAVQVSGSSSEVGAPATGPATEAQVVGSSSTAAAAGTAVYEAKAANLVMGNPSADTC